MINEQEYFLKFEKKLQKLVENVGKFKNLVRVSKIKTLKVIQNCFGAKSSRIFR